MIFAIPRVVGVLVAFSLLLIMGRPLYAQSALVVLVKPAETNPTVTEALTRIRGELVADGFQVTLVDAPNAADPASALTRAGSQIASAAMLGLFVRRDGSADLWVIDRLTNKTVERRLEVEPGSEVPSAEVLARRAVDLLRASLLEVLVTTGKPATTMAPPVAVQWAAKAIEKRRSPWGIEAGAAILGGFGGIDPAVLPVLRARLAVHQRFSARLTMAGLGTRPEIAGSGATASVSQEVFLLELLMTLARASAFRPVLSLGVGAYHIGVRGSAEPPNEGRTDGHVVFAADAGAGLSFPLTSSFELVLETHALLASPLPVVRFNEETVARSGQPLLLGALTLVGWL